MSVSKCKFCGCTDNDCSQCITKTGKPCSWINDNQDICSACVNMGPVVEFLKAREQVSINDLRLEFCQSFEWAFAVMYALERLELVSAFDGVPNRSVLYENES